MPRTLPANATIPIIALLLFLATLALFSRTAGYDFVSYDDPLFITANPQVQSGLTWQGLKWALTTGIDGNWIPVTWLSHMVAVQLFGDQPAAHHLINTLLHAVNAVLLFLLLNKISDAPLRSAAVAAIFALHPLRVESVAWVAERKDVLSGLFLLLTILAYLLARERSGRGVTGTVIVWLLLALMAKPIAVTIPFLIVILEYWQKPGQGTNNLPAASPIDRRVVMDAVTLLAVAAPVMVITVLFQADVRAVTDVGWHGIPETLANVLAGYAEYLRLFFHPTGLAVFYPFTGDISVSRWGGGLILLIATTAALFRQRRIRPYLAVGWGWYLVTLLPVSGIVPVGAQSHADRYSYIPLIGVTISTVWGWYDLTTRFRQGRLIAAASLAVAIAACTLATSSQLPVWRESVTLYEHALKVTKGNWLAHNNLAAVFIQQDRLADAERHLRAALAIRPGYAKAYANLGLVASRQGRHREAIGLYVEAIAHMPYRDSEMYRALAEEFAAASLPDGTAATLREMETFDPEGARNLRQRLTEAGLTGR